MRVAPAAALLVLALASPARADAPSPAESKIRQEAAERILQFAGWCAQNGAKGAGTEALEEARGLDGAAPALGGIEKALGEATDGGADAAAVAKQRREAGKEVAKAYDRLASLKHDAKEDARFEQYGLSALAWDPSDGRVKRAAAAAEAAQKGNRILAAGLLVRGALRADPEGAAKGKYDGLVDRVAQSSDLFVLAPAAHDLVAYVSLPRGWRKGGSCPILVAVDGAGCGFEGCGKGFATSRGSRPVIVVSPATLSNTNDLQPAKYPAYSKALLDRWNGNRIEFDGPGMEAVLAEVRKRFGAEEKVFVTGFSGGGNYCYYKLLHDPKGVRGAAPCCANFSGMGVDGAPGAGEGGGPPVHIFTGEKDEHREWTFGKVGNPGIEPQTDRAVEVLKGLGYANLRRTQVPGAGHSPLREKVWAFVDDVMGKK